MHEVPRRKRTGHLKRLNLMNSQKVKIPVTLAKAGVHNDLELLDSRFRGNDKNEVMRTFYETIKLVIPHLMRNPEGKTKRPTAFYYALIPAL